MLVRSVALSKAAPNRVLLLGCIAAAFATFAFREALFHLVRLWSTQEEYSHGFLIPIIAAWLLWRRRNALIASIARPAWSGPGLILLAMLMHTTGQLGGMFVLSPLAFVVTLMGITLAIGGFDLLRVAFLPIAFLLFAIPLPSFIQSYLSIELQLISSRLGVAFIRLFQIPVYLDGNLIDLGYYKLQVVEACSGLRYLFPLFSLSFLAAYLFRAPPWQRALVLFSSIPITIAMNGIRIGIVGVTVDRWGPRMADGALHFFEGWIIFLASALFLALEVALLARISGKRFSEVFSYPTATAPQKNTTAEFEPRTLGQFYACLILIFATTVLGALTFNRPETTKERDRFVTFPSIVGDWRGRSSLLDPQVERFLGMDDYILSDYSSPDGKTVNFYAAYYSSERSGQIPHSPLDCIPSDGWLITKFERANVDADHPVNRAIIERDGSKQLVYYWYEKLGERITTEYFSKWLTLYDAVLAGRSDGALVRLITPLAPDEPEQNADARLKRFVHDLGPILNGYLGSADAKKTAAVDRSTRPEAGTR